MQPSPPTPVQLTPTLVSASDAIFKAVSNWPFKAPHQYVGEILREDIPRRALFGHCRIWVYREPAGELVGIGTVAIATDWERIAGKPHLYIPVLTISPTVQSKGYGRSIVEHLIGDAILLAASNPKCCQESLYLDVYTDNQRAIDLYRSFDFREIAGPLLDDKQGNRPYTVMAKRVSPA